MKATFIPLAAGLLSTVLISGCVTRPTATISKPSPGPAVASAAARPSYTPPPAPLPDYGLRPPAGSHAASRVTGDYAGYPALDRFIDRMVSRHGFRPAYLYGLFSQAKRKQWTLDYLGRESGTPSKGGPPKPGGWSRYRAQFLTELHISRGAAFWTRHASALQRASARFGVPPEFILGILGVETVYGANVGKDRIIDALTTLAFDYPRRAAYFTEELENFLVMAKSEGMDPSKPVGSYAGAMGLGQFMPGSFLKWAVDLDGDGHKDLWNPVDAIGSIANYFAAHGWRGGEPVVIPAVVTGSKAKTLEYGLDKQYSLATLMGYGIQPAPTVRTAAASPRNGSVRLLRLGTYSGEEYWLGHDNFYVITRYNHSTHYAMAVYQLGQAVKQRYAQTVASVQ
jgi:membrane-bound lytic murein transglycosylase B